MPSSTAHVFLAIFVTARLGHAAVIQTADTILELKAEPASLTVIGLRSSTFEWMEGESGSRAIPFVSEAVVDGHSEKVTWRLKSDSGAGGSAARHTFLYACETLGLEMSSTWIGSDGPGPVEHEMTIANQGKQTIHLPMPPTVALNASCPAGDAVLENWWVEKGAGHPSAVGLHRDQVTAGFSRSLVSTPYSGDNPPEPIPWTAVFDPAHRRGWYAGVESSAKVRLGFKRTESAHGATLEFEAGLAADSAGRTRLGPGETLRLPVVFIGTFEGDVDDGCNHLRQWVRTAICPPVHDMRYPLLVNNSWGSGMNIDETLCKKMIDESANLGLELFHIDAGWFRGVGDWRPDAKKFPNGLAPVADYAHGKGLKFGLWVGWTQGGSDREGTGAARPLSVFDDQRRDWFPEDAAPDWRPADFTGKTVCLGDPRAAAWCLGELRRIIAEYKLDLLEHDQAMVVTHCSRTDHLHTSSPTDVSFRAAQGYYTIYDTLRRENPALLFEDCVNGGRMVDYGVLRRTHYVSITDTYDPLSNRRAFYDASFALPPATCECYIENRPAETPAKFRSMLRSGMMGWCTIMADTSRWTPEQHTIARRQFEIYKTVLRSLIKQAGLYHVSERPDGIGWDGIQYWDQETGKGVLFSFRGSGGPQEHRFILKGLSPAEHYHLSSEDGSIESGEFTGETLASQGLNVRLAEPESSDLIYLSR